MIALILFVLVQCLFPATSGVAQEELSSPKHPVYNPNTVTPQRGGISAGLFDDTNPPKEDKGVLITPTPAARQPTD